MYKKPQDIISDLLQEDIGVDIQTPTGVNLKPPEPDTDIGVDIERGKDIRIKPQISIDIVNNNARTTKFEMKRILDHLHNSHFWGGPAIVWLTFVSTGGIFAAGARIFVAI